MADAPSLDPQYNTAIQGFEGFTPTATWDVNRHRNGYGTNALYPGETIDKSEADRRYSSEMGNASALVDGQFPNLPAGHRAALSSLTFNAGPSWMGSGLGDAVRSGDTQAIKDKFLQYNKSEGKVNDGLSKRRAAEAKWFDAATPMGQAMTPDNAQPTAGQATPAMLAAMTGGQGALSNGGNALDRFNAPDTLGNVGAWLMAAGGDKSAPGMLAALNSKQKEQNYSVVTDKLGRQMVFDHRTGKFMQAGGGVGGAGNPQNVDDALAATPEALAARAKNTQDESSKKMGALSDAAAAAADLKAKALEAMELSKDPDVYQGGLAHAAASAANLPIIGGMFGKSIQKTAALDKINAELTAAYMKSMGSMRVAGPEIKFGQMGSADLDKPGATNQQIYSDYMRHADQAQKAYELGSQHMKTHGVLGQAFTDDLNQMYRDNPSAALNPELKSQPALPKGVQSIKVIQ